MDNPILTAALAYAAQGWPVFPIDPSRKTGKEPYRGSNGVSDATTDARQIKAWWKRHPEAQVAMDVGGAQMMVLDLDPGYDMKELEENVGKLPKTHLIQRTPRGGLHLFFALDNDEYVSPSAGKLASQVDVRSFHSYVLLFPSKTPDGMYSWEEDGKPARRSDEMVRVACVATKKHKDRDTWVIEPDTEGNVREARRWLVEDAKLAIQGSRGDHCTYATAAKLKSLGISQGLALTLMLENWNDRCVPPWDSDELETKVENGYAYNRYPPGSQTAAYKAIEMQKLFAPETVKDAPGDTSRVGSYTLRDHVAMAHLRAPSWLIHDCIPDDSYAILFGTHGTFKTFLALDMALSLARGYDGQPGLAWIPEHRGAVLFAAGEGLLGLNKRKLGWEKLHNRGEAVEKFVLLNPAPMSTITEEELSGIIKDALRRHPAGYTLTVIDTIGRAMTGANENDQSDAARFTSLVHRLRTDLGGSILALHHTGVSETERLRGSSVFSADADTIIKTEALPGRIAKLSMVKQKEDASWEKPKHVKLHELDLPDGQRTLVAVPPSIEEIEKAKEGPAMVEPLMEQEAHVSIIIAALHTMPDYKQEKGRYWSVSALASACRAQGYQKGKASLQSDVLGQRAGKDGWARSHPALVGYYLSAEEQWYLPSPVPEIPLKYQRNESDE